MKIDVISFGTNNYKIGNYTKKINEKYCKKNNYNFNYYHKIPFHLITRHPAWCKIFYLNKKMNESNSDYVMWIDGDAFFCNNNIKIEKWITNDKSIIIGRDPGFTMDEYRKHPELLNSGVMIFKNTKENKSLLKNILYNPIHCANYNKNLTYNILTTQRGWDQAAIRYSYLNNKYMNENTHVILDTNFNNNTNDIKKYIENNGFVLHLTNFNNKFYDKKTDTILKFCKFYGIQL